MAQTIRQLTNCDWAAATLPSAALVLVCMQSEFRSGPLQLTNIDTAIDDARVLLDRFRNAGAPIFHVARCGTKGKFFDLAQQGGTFVAELKPADGEPVLETHTQNPFISTDLAARLQATGFADVVFAGCSSHSSLNSAVRYAAEHGFRPTVVASACATRDLPGPGGITLPAQIVHLATMAGLADSHACIVDHAREIRDMAARQRVT